VKRERGEATSHAPYGFRAEGGRLVADEGEQAVVARVRALRDAGLSQRGIVAELARAGVVGRTGRPLALLQVQNILKAAA
jgi:hypothetical protein